MKKALIILLLLIQTISFCQENLSYSVKYEYRNSLNGSLISQVSELTSDNEISFFNYDKKLKFNKNIKKIEDTNSGEVSVTLDYRDTIGNYQFIDFKKKIINERRLLDKKYYYISDTLKKPSWNLIDTTKVINEIPCNMAKTNFYGRTYYAWYSISFPISRGPWKLNGLPGLIIEAYNEDRSIYFKAIEVKKKKTESLDDIKKSEDSITLYEFFDIKRKSIERFEKFFKSMNSEGVNVDFEIQSQEIEIIDESSKN